MSSPDQIRLSRSLSSLSLDDKPLKQNCPRGGSLASSSASSDYEDISWNNNYGKQFANNNIPNVSKWKRDDLEGFGLYYDDNESSILDLVSLVEKRIRKKSLKTMPEVTKLLVKLTKDYFTLTMSNCCGHRNHVQREDLLEEVKESSNKISESVKEVENKSAALHKENDRRIFYTWYNRLQAFLENSLPRILLKKYTEVKEIDHQWLFMKFSEIFLLDPEPGDIFRREMTINGQSIVCATNVRFVCSPLTNERGMTCAVVMIPGVKSASSEDEDFDLVSLSDDILGQLGGQMLFETMYSAFWPGVIGILCVRTKLFFLYCEIKQHHLESIQKNGKPDEDAGNHCNIHFTKAFNYMKAADRNEILEFFFWLGFVQSAEYWDW